MKIAIIGGAGIRVPLVTNGLFRENTNLTVTELSLFDIDADRCATIARISRAMARRAGGAVRVSQPSTLDEALEGASFVICSIRVGGIAGRIQDERIALDHGLPGQETVGPGGFALAMRTIPVLVEYAAKVAELAPKAWMINFTNPVGIMAEALLSAGIGERCIGVCDTPREQFLHLAEALGVPLGSASFDYLGLNHLGWIRGIKVDGQDRMQELLGSDGALERAYPVSFFSRDFLRELGLFPTEYLFFYYSPEQAYRQTAAAGNTRGGLIQQLERRLMQSVAESDGSDTATLEAYDLYLASRNASYMAIESGGAVDHVKLEAARAGLYNSAAGYERIAMDVMESISGNCLRVMPVDVANQGAIADFDSDAAVEVPCAIDANGARPLATGRLPAQVRDLAVQVKEYERLSVRAALDRSRTLAVDALAANPLVTDRELAGRLVGAYQTSHAPSLDYLR